MPAVSVPCRMRRGTAGTTYINCRNVKAIHDEHSAH